MRTRCAIISAKVLRPDTEVVFHGQAPGTYPGDYPGDDIGYGYTYWIHGNQWVAAGRAAEAQGFDAFAMCTLPNPMLREVRSIVDIPVIGMGETCCHLATMFGQRFAIMLFIERMIPLYQEQVRNYGLTDRCAGVVASGLRFQDVLPGYASPGPVVEKFQEAARRVIKETGADVIIPGEVPLNLLMARNGITRVDDVTDHRRSGDHDENGRTDGRFAKGHRHQTQPARLVQFGTQPTAAGSGRRFLRRRQADILTREGTVP